jgi:hypothetical protein
MNKELRAKLIKEHPSLLGRRLGVGVGNGWFNLVHSLCLLVKSHANVYNLTVRVTQIKEKFGGLRFYVRDSDEYIDGAIRLAESISYLTCEECGNPGALRQENWWKTRCDTCQAAKDNS